MVCNRFGAFYSFNYAICPFYLLEFSNLMDKINYFFFSHFTIAARQPPLTDSANKSTFGFISISLILITFNPHFSNHSSASVMLCHVTVCTGVNSAIGIEKINLEFLGESPTIFFKYSLA